MNSLNITVQVDPGTSIEKAAKDAIILAGKLNTAIDFRFNDVQCIACPKDNIADLVKSYYEAAKSKSQYKTARA